MDKGHISAVGTHEELLASNEIYQEVYYSQVKGGSEDETAEITKRTGRNGKSK